MNDKQAEQVIELLASIYDKVAMLCNDASLQHEMLAEWKWQQLESDRMKRFEGRSQRSEMLRGGWS